MSKESKREASRKWARLNKDSQKERLTAWRKKNPEKVKAQNHRNRHRHFKYKYGLTVVDVERMYITQLGCCAICENWLEPPPAKTTCIDHDHKTGKVRGLLCKQHNFLLGLAADDPELLRLAATYLETRR